MGNERFTEREFTELLAGALENGNTEEELGGTTRVTTFVDGGVFTNNEGFTVKLANGQEFQVTVVESHQRW